MKLKNLNKDQEKCLSNVSSQYFKLFVNVKKLECCDSFCLETELNVNIFNKSNNCLNICKDYVVQTKIVPFFDLNENFFKYAVLKYYLFNYFNIYE